MRQNKLNIEEARSLFKENFIGPEELNKIKKFIDLEIPKEIPEIDIDLNNINIQNNILILGIEKLRDGSLLNILKFVSKFGNEPNVNHPNFYNQDWYLSESFCTETISLKWYLIEKKVAKDTRGVSPNEIKEICFPSAILCTYVFFINWFYNKEILWENDFVWCSDKDFYGDRIYVGKYRDQINPNRSGFSIHRHLEIKNNYGVVKSKY